MAMPYLAGHVQRQDRVGSRPYTRRWGNEEAKEKKER
jgi:hypothetical protein